MAASNTTVVTVSARIAHLVLAVAGARGVARESLASAAGLRLAELEGPEARIPLSTELALWTHAARLAGDDFFGVHAAEAYRPGQFDVFDYVCRCAGTLRGAVERAVRYNHLNHDIAEFRLVEQGDEARLLHRFRGELGGPVRHAAEFTLASALAAARLWTGRPLAARGVAFMHPAPAALAHLQSFFATRQLGAQSGATG